MSGVDHELLLRADFEHVAHCRKNLAVCAEDLDAFRRVLEMLDVIVGIEGGEPHDAAVAALHTPHPVDGIGIDSAGRRINNDPAEHLQASDVLAREPGAVGRRARGWPRFIFPQSPRSARCAGCTPFRACDLSLARGGSSGRADELRVKPSRYVSPSRHLY